MQVRINRDSVHAGDDVEPHDEILHIADVETLDALVTSVLTAYALPLIAGGRATWCLTSRRPIAVIAQQWSAPRLLSREARPIADCAIVDGIVRLHFTYLAQIDPEVALEVVQRLHLEN